MALSRASVGCVGLKLPVTDCVDFWLFWIVLVTVVVCVGGVWVCVFDEVLREISARYMKLLARLMRTFILIQI